MKDAAAAKAVVAAAEGTRGLRHSVVCTSYQGPCMCGFDALRDALDALHLARKVRAARARGVQGG